MGASGVGGGGAPECQEGTDCGTAAVCDPQTQTCGPPGCTTTMPTCPAGEVCLFESNGLGACYTSCAAGQPASCPAGETCIDVNTDEQKGACAKTGPAGKGQPCNLTDTSTGCALGLLCLLDANMVGQCYDTCDFWGGTGSCPASGEYCDNRGFCLSAQDYPIDPAPLGATCFNDGWGCGAVGDKVQGHCIDTGTQLLCLPWCRTALGNADCPSGQTCYDVGLVYFGLCYV